jgi:hypothetical protein
MTVINDVILNYFIMPLLACVIISKILFILNLTGLFTLIIVMDEKYGYKKL